jgi:DNA primase
MTGRISDEAIRAIRERASLSEVISDVIALRRRGRSATGLCPFHAEKTPSFTVSEERGFFHCFGCGEHGDVFAFVMKTESLPFPDAVRRVAERFGMPVPEEAGPRRATSPLAAVNLAAAAFFQRELAAPGGARARAYLTERGLDAETIQRFGVGYAPGAGEALARHLRASGTPTEDALTVGLLLRRDRPGNGGPVFDRFRDRVMFPITDPTGKVIAFGGRILPDRPASGDPPPKYMNSPESPIFHKGQTLYGLVQAREAIRARGRALVVEGYLDVIALAQAGIGEVVAPLGTALTADQLRVLRRHTDGVIACFDGDTAGRRAAARSFPTFLEAGLWGRGAFLPAGDDPDTFVRREGREALENVLAAAVPLVDAFTAELAGERRDAVSRRVEAAREVARLLKQVAQNDLEYGALARLAAERLGVPEELLRKEGAPDKPAAIVLGAREAAGSEAMLIELMASDAALAERVADAGVIAEFQQAEWRQVAERLIAVDPSVDRTSLIQDLPRPLQDRVVRRLLGDVPPELEDRDQVLADCIADVRRRRDRRTKQQLREELKAAEARGDAVARDDAMRRLSALLTSDTSEKARTSS